MFCFYGFQSNSAVSFQCWRQPFCSLMQVMICVCVCVCIIWGYLNTFLPMCLWAITVASVFRFPHRDRHHLWSQLCPSAELWYDSLCSQTFCADLLTFCPEEPLWFVWLIQKAELSMSRQHSTVVQTMRPAVREKLNRWLLIQAAPWCLLKPPSATGMHLSEWGFMLHNDMAARMHLSQSKRCSTRPVERGFLWEEECQGGLAEFLR